MIRVLIVISILIESAQAYNKCYYMISSINMPLIKNNEHKTKRPYKLQRTPSSTEIIKYNISYNETFEKLLNNTIRK